MSKIDDILTGSKDLKKMPYSVPEGYFESLGEKVRGRIALETVPQGAKAGRRFTFPTRLIPYLSAAAAVAVVVAIGLTLGSLGRKSVIPEDGLQDSDYVFYYTEIIPVTDPESIYYSYNSDSDTYAVDDLVYDDMSYDDIIEYLIESGVDVNTLIHDLN